MPAGILGRRTIKHRRSARFGAADRPTPIRITGVTASGSVLAVEFDQAVALSGVPAYTTNVAGAKAVSAVAKTPTTIEITFSATIATATSVTVPYEDPAVRNSIGGFVVPYESLALV